MCFSLLVGGVDQDAGGLALGIDVRQCQMDSDTTRTEKIHPGRELAKEDTEHAEKDHEAGERIALTFPMKHRIVVRLPRHLAASER
jgi:hypothetical protein